ncbi:MAG: hypothetical protein L0I67_00055, partial [Enterobacterales bacterium]|nr:hypothetical protein [Enterobacterales bacterium]
KYHKRIHGYLLLIDCYLFDALFLLRDFLFSLHAIFNNRVIKQRDKSSVSKAETLRKQVRS